MGIGYRYCCNCVIAEIFPCIQMTAKVQLLILADQIFPGHMIIIPWKFLAKRCHMTFEGCLLRSLYTGMLFRYRYDTSFCIPYYLSHPSSPPVNMQCMPHMFTLPEPPTLIPSQISRSCEWNSLLFTPRGAGFLGVLIRDQIGADNVHFFSGLEGDRRF